MKRSAASLATVSVLTILFLLVASIGCSDSPPAASDEELQVFALTIKKRSVAASSEGIRVLQGQQVEIQWLTDEATTVHLHGYDIGASLKPGAPFVWNFKANATGRFPIEAHDFGNLQAAVPGHGHHHSEQQHSHDSNLELVRGTSSDTGAAAKTLLYLEVHPR